MKFRISLFAFSISLFAFLLLAAPAMAETYSSLTMNSTGVVQDPVVSFANSTLTLPAATTALFAPAGNYTLSNDARLSLLGASGNYTGNITASQISDSTTAGRALLTAGNATLQRSSLGLGASDNATLGGLKVGTTSKKIEVYNLDTDASNYERGFLRWSSNVLELGTEAAGTGTARGMKLLAAANEVSASNSVQTYLTVRNTNAAGAGVLYAASNNDVSYAQIQAFGLSASGTLYGQQKARSVFILGQTSSGGVVVYGTEGNNPVVFIQNGSERARIAGADLELAGTAAGIILKSPDGTRYKVTVANGGTLTVTAQ